MLRFRINGIKDGKHEIELQADVSKIPEMPEEYIGDIFVTGLLTKIGKRLTYVGTISCDAKMICDISLEEFLEKISCDFEFSFMSNNDLYYLNKAKGTMETDSGEVILHEDDQEIDISEQIRQELMLNLPMKRIAPEYRDKTIEELYPEFLDSNQNNSQIDERWKGLEGLTLEN
jgi:uncharacterized metal-binding protein YceD (DUF177 family)